MLALLNQITFWHWLGFGAMLLILELVTGSGFLFWIGMSAGFIGCLLWLFPDLHWSLQLIGFAAVSILTAFLWWYYLKRNPLATDKPTLNRRSEQYIGRIFTLEVPIINGSGKIRVEDSIWRVKCHMDLPVGAKIEIVEVDGVVLIAVPV